MDRTNIVTPTVTAVPRNEHWMKIFSSASSSDCCRTVRFPSKLSFHCSLVLFNLGAGIKREARGENCGHRFCPKLSITAKIFAAAALKEGEKVCFKTGHVRNCGPVPIDQSHICALLSIGLIYCEREVLKTYPHSLVEPSCHNPFENYWELPICWPETWKYENDKEINPNCWTECWKLKNEECICSGLHLPHCWATPLPKVIAENGKELEPCWPPCLELFAPFTACTYSYLWYSQGKYLTLNRPLIRSSSTNIHNPSCLPSIFASLKKKCVLMRLDFGSLLSAFDKVVVFCSHKLLNR